MRGRAAMTLKARRRALAAVTLAAAALLAGACTPPQLFGWGSNSFGQVGNGSTTTNATTPVGIDQSFTSVAGGERHTVAVRTDGTLWAWGYNGYGQLGDGTTTAATPPPRSARHRLEDHHRRPPLHRWPCAATAPSGPGATTSTASSATAPTPTPLPDPDRQRHQLEDGQRRRRLPHRRPAHRRHPLGLGPQQLDQLGDGTTVDRNTPTQIGYWTVVSGGTHHSAAIRSDGSLWAWGRNQSGSSATEPQRCTPSPP